MCLAAAVQSAGCSSADADSEATTSVATVTTPNTTPEAAPKGAPDATDILSPDPTQDWVTPGVLFGVMNDEQLLLANGLDAYGAYDVESGELMARTQPAPRVAQGVPSVYEVFVAHSTPYLPRTTTETDSLGVITAKWQLLALDEDLQPDSVVMEQDTVVDSPVGIPKFTPAGDNVWMLQIERFGDDRQTITATLFDPD